MEPCSVLRCPDAPSAVLHPYAETADFAFPICAHHDTAIKGGSRWILAGEYSDLDGPGSPPRIVHSILMGDDLPPAISLSGFTGEIVGSENGHLVTFQSEKNGHVESLEFFISQESGVDLGQAFLGRPPRPDEDATS